MSQREEQRPSRPNFDEEVFGSRLSKRLNREFRNSEAPPPPHTTEGPSKEELEELKQDVKEGIAEFLAFIEEIKPEIPKVMSGIGDAITEISGFLAPMAEPMLVAQAAKINEIMKQHALALNKGQEKIYKALEEQTTILKELVQVMKGE